MGSSDAETSAKAPKSSAPAQDQPPASSSTQQAPSYPEWPAYQAYSPMPPHGFYPSPVAGSPTGHPYMWGPQHMMPPYGTPPPPYVMYPPGVYAHPSLPPGSHPFSPYAVPSPNGNVESGAAPGGMVEDGKSSEGKEKSSLKGSKGSLGSLNMLTGNNNNDQGKAANGGFSHSGESGSDASSEGSDANSQNDSQPKTSGGQDSYDDAPHNGNRSLNTQNGVPRTPSQQMLNQAMTIVPMPVTGVPGAVAGPTTNLNIGMDYWGTTTTPLVPSIRAKGRAAAVGAGHAPGAQEWVQDERELKRQKRKQSNRESARRSRLRKQAECEELAQRVDVLKEENASLKAEINRLRQDYDQLLSQNNLLKNKLGDLPRGAEDPRFDRNGQHSADDHNQRPLDSDVQTDPTESSH